MHPALQNDLESLPSLLASAQAMSIDFLSSINDRPAGQTPTKAINEDVDDTTAGIGGAATLERFRTTWLPHLAASAGPRYLGFVTGGATPASLVGDWLTSAVDQNPTSSWDSEAPSLERETIKTLGRWFNVPSHTGIFVTGATMSNTVGLAIGREWVGRQRGVTVSVDGVTALGPVRIFGAALHSSIYKAASILGLGRAAVHTVAALPGREAIDVDALDLVLAANPGSIVVATLGSVNSGDFDDIVAIAALKAKHSFWLHVDGAFGAFAALDARLALHVAGLDAADSVCIDCHKWMNVPYDSALQFTRHRDLQVAVFQNAAAYLGNIGPEPNSVHLTPENSRRWRALAAWFGVHAYGRDGHADIVRRNVDCARALAARLDGKVQLLAPVRLNIVLFAAGEKYQDEAAVLALLARLTATGEAFMTPTVFQGQWAIRAAFSNWRTTDADVDRIYNALVSVL
ncbi:Aste57867_25105 [Aphanomyces stellatus]|uniref:Aste57867_25105 protein n=1 Tax=Aphanomyces stellatus TaxID=120398 RepID=A0A485LS97_9STRA|nr:hypothetical protein As57867_025027 [Aphanomyces stellatus]VFU01736.1 Aste57867_25105 [Aphanomyces stellatus]